MIQQMWEYAGMEPLKKKESKQGMNSGHMS